MNLMDPRILNLALQGLQLAGVASKLVKQVERGALTAEEALADWDRVRDETRAAEARWRNAGRNDDDGQET